MYALPKLLLADRELDYALRADVRGPQHAQA
jgi:hypothetical protein